MLAAEGADPDRRVLSRLHRDSTEANDLVSTAQVSKALKPGLVSGAALQAVLGGFKSQANTEHYRHVITAIAAAPGLNAKLDRLAASGTLKALELVHPDDPRLEDTPEPLGASAEGGSILFTAKFLETQLRDTEAGQWDKAAPFVRSLVFVLGHLTYHLEKPFNPGKSRPTRDEYVAMRMTDEATAYIRGWNDLVEAVSRAKGVASTPQDWLSMLRGFRYRAAFASEEVAAIIGTSGAIQASPANVSILGRALLRTEIADFK